MKIELSERTIRDLVKNYEDNDFEGVKGFNGKLDIRPPYQREFVYKDAQRHAVIDTVFKGFPLIFSFLFFISNLYYDFKILNCFNIAKI